MSRSIHTTRKDLREARLRSYRDDSIKAAEVAAVAKELAHKRRIKEAISIERSVEAVESAMGVAGSIPIRIEDSGPHILHPATREDIEAIQRRLPAGVMEGLSEIVLSLGAHVQSEAEDAEFWDPDPITNRIGRETIPGFYKGWIQGLYHPSLCRITLHSLVSDPPDRSPVPTAAYFKLQILSTFVHEVAHHFDHTRRVARGRWLADETEKVECFADHHQHEWTQGCVVPYLLESYPADVAALLEWIEAYGAVRFELGELISDRRRVCVSTIESAVEDLVKDVVNETDRLERLFDFAINLKISDRYERSQEAVNQILVESPGHLDALELRASIWNFQGKHAGAAALALEVLGRNPLHSMARRTLIRAYEGLEQWTLVIQSATESLALFDNELDRFQAIASRCRANWKLGNRAASDEDLRTLQSSPRSSWRVERILREREEA